MSCYFICPTCGRMLADKEAIFKKEKINIESKNLTQEELNKAYDKLWEKLKIPVDNLCCRRRLLTYAPLEDIVK